MALQRSETVEAPVIVPRIPQESTRTGRIGGAALLRLGEIQHCTKQKQKECIVFGTLLEGIGRHELHSQAERADNSFVELDPFLGALAIALGKGASSLKHSVIPLSL